jgi:hypothetical protein
LHLLEIPLESFEGPRLKTELVESILLGVSHSITIADKAYCRDHFKFCIPSAQGQEAPPPPPASRAAVTDNKHVARGAVSVRRNELKIGSFV